MKNKDKLDVDSLNEVIVLSKKILRIGLIVAIILLVVLLNNLFRSWKLLSMLKTLFVVVSPFFLGLLIAWLFDPLVKKLSKKKIPRLVCCLIIYFVLLLILTSLVYFLAPAFISQIKDFIAAFPNVIDDVKEFVSGIFRSLTYNTSLNLDNAKRQLFLAIEGFSKNITHDLPTTIVGIAKSVFSGGMIFILGLMIGFYMLYDFDKVEYGLLNILPKTWRKNAKELVKRINKSLRGYVQGVFIVMVLVFITQSIGFTLAGLRAPLVFALFCAFTDIIPYFGPYIGAIPAVIVAFTISPMTGICTLISVIVVQLLENNFYQPIIMGHTMKLHPVTIILGLLIFEHLFGILGMIVATPMIACLKVIFKFVDEKVAIIDKIKEK